MTGGAREPLSLELRKLVISFVWNSLCPACLLPGRAESVARRDRAARGCEAGAAHSRAGPSSLLCKSTLVSVNFCHLLIPLAQQLKTEKGGTLQR